MPTKADHQILIDTDVIINWLTKETETITDKELWKAPFEIISRIEAGQLEGFISLLTVFEIRFFLRRKKKISESQVNADVQKLTEIIEVLIPDEIELLRANKLQGEYPLDPFDAILFSLALGIPEVTLISRDREFLRFASRFVEVSSPEEFLTRL